jgi:Domain of unknown function (DUF4383)
MSNTRADRAAPTRTSVQKAALAVGVVFLAVGVAGFIPGVTTNYDTLALASHHSEALLLGLFQVSILHNIVHLLFGVAGLVAALRSAEPAATWSSVARCIWCCSCTG